MVAELQTNLKKVYWFDKEVPSKKSWMKMHIFSSFQFCSMSHEIWTAGMSGYVGERQIFRVLKTERNLSLVPAIFGILS